MKNNLIRFLNLKLLTMNLPFSRDNIKSVSIIWICFPSFTAFSVRLFSVLRYEVMIHEFDPYFNYRTTKYLAEEGFYKFHNWFDDRAWYPLGRIIGKKYFYFLRKYISHSPYQPEHECESLDHHG